MVNNSSEKSMSLKRGALIVVEGVDRSGKSTQCKKLVNSLLQVGLKADYLNFPDRKSLTGGLIHKYLTDKTCSLSDEAIHLLFSANRWENHDSMKKMLNEGCSLIVDRYSYSGIAFSSIKDNMNIHWCIQPEIGLIKPDLVLLFTLSEEEMTKRPGFGDERYEKISIQQSVKEIFEKFAQVEDNWKIINAAGSIDVVHQKFLGDVLKKIQEVEYSPLKKLEFSEKY